MEKFILVPQPPKTPKFNFLVDEISVGGLYGRTTDIDKISYNCELLGDEFKRDLKAEMFLSDSGGIKPFPVGCFITTLEIGENEVKKAMTFCDFTIGLPTDQLISVLRQGFPERLVIRWLALQQEMRLKFRQEDDIAALFVPES